MTSDVETINRFINHEREWRKRVFKPGHKDRETKLAECEMAANALERLAGRLHKLEEQTQQPTLFTPSNKEIDPS